MNEDSVYLPPQTILKGRYEIETEIGRGGFSVVFDARDLVSNSSVAIKLLVPPPAAARIAKERMQREVKAVRSLNHSSIVPVFDFLEEGSWTFIVMERVEGSDLQSRVLQQGPLDPEMVRNIGREIAGGLAHAHMRGILHRDVKPQNILIDLSGLARLTDFGSARIEGQSTLTHSGAMVGTLDFAAPEVLEGQRSDARSDIFSLGLTLYFALTGSLPDRNSPYFPPTPLVEGFRPSGVRSGIPNYLDEIVARATAKSPGERFPTAGVMLKVLEIENKKEVSVPASKRLVEQSCSICGAFEPLGASICSGCRSYLLSKPKIKLFLQPPVNRKAREASSFELSKITGISPNSYKLKEAISGRRPLADVHPDELDRVMQNFSNRKLPLFRSAQIADWRAVPIGFYILLAAVLIVGTASGIVAEKQLIWITPLVILILLFSALQITKAPVLKPSKSTWKLPGKLQERSMETIASLEEGTAKNLLKDIIWMSRDFFRILDKPEAPPELQQYLNQLLESSCDAAGELQRLDRTLIRLEAQHAEIARFPAQWMEAHCRCENARDSLVQRLLEGIASLGFLRSDLTLAPHGINQQLVNITNGIQNEIELQSEVAQRIDKLLRFGDDLNENTISPSPEKEIL